MDFYIKPLSKQKALQKGVESAIQYILFYGSLLTIAFYETKKALDNAQKSKQNLIKIQQQAVQNRIIIASLRSQFLEQEQQIKTINRHVKDELEKATSKLQDCSKQISLNNQEISQKIDQISQQLQHLSCKYLQLNVQGQKKSEQKK